MRFSLLGPLVVADNAGSQVTIGGPRLRVLLAALLLHAGIPVPAGELAELVWDGSPPHEAIATLRSYASRLRRALGGDGPRIAACGPGYLIRVSQEELDALEFEALCQDSRAALRAGEWEAASETAVRALRLWRAPPLLDVPADALHEEFVPRLERLRLQVLEDRLDAGFRLGRHEELAPELLDMTARYPLRERFHAQLMVALAQTGRRAQALHAYQLARGILHSELGIEPGPELRALHQRILAGDAADAAGIASAVPYGEAPDAIVPGDLAVVGALPAVSAPAPVRTESAEPLPSCPAQLPPDIADFTGRRAQAHDLCDALTAQEAASGPGTVRIVVVAGAAGLGKTTLAVHSAHRVRDSFPDGQLYVHLSGASRQPAIPGEVLARLLRDLGVASDKIPAAEEERAALYRTQLAGRRVLVLLDDAKDATQVRPLLPGSAACAVLVTTRNKTLNLLSSRPTDLSTLSGPEAMELFARVVSDARPAAEPEATAEILRACAGLPLAIRICAGRLATRRQWPVATMSARLRDERCRLDELQAGDLEVRASFQVSYDSLDTARHRADPAHVFRFLGFWQGRRISLPAAAALVGQREADVASALEALVDVNLLESPEPDHYQFHDLLRLFASERAQAEETEQARALAMARLLQWYLATATAAADVLSPHRYLIPGDEPPSPGPPPGSAQDALAWYDHEQANLLMVVREAAAAGFHEVAWRLPAAMYPFLNRRENWADCITAHRLAVTSARVSGSRPGEAWALQNLGQSLAIVGETEAFTCLEEALAIRRELGDLAGQAMTAVSISGAHYELRGPQSAYGYSLGSLDALRQAGSPALLAVGLNNHGEFCRVLGKTDEATECLQEALGIWTAIGGGYAHGQVLENLGRIHLEVGRLPEAIASLSESYRLSLAEGHLMGQAVALQYLGQAQRAADQEAQARASLEAALALFTNLKAGAEVEATQFMLAGLTHPPSQ